LCEWVERGVVIIDSSETYGNEWKAYALKILKSRKVMCANRKPGKPVYVLDLTTLGGDAIEVERNAIYRLD
jgi:hypothetical protein